MTTFTTSINGLIGKGTLQVGGIDTNLQLWGLSHLVGATVSVFALFRDCGDFIVAADGSVTIPLAPASIGGNIGVITIANIITTGGTGNLDYGESTTRMTVHNGAGPVVVNVPVVIGQPFVSQGQTLRPVTQADLKVQSGESQGMKRRLHRYSALVNNGVEVSFGTSLTPSPLGNMFDVQFARDNLPVTSFDGNPFRGVWRGETNDDYTFDGMLCWQVDRPWPCTISAVSSFLHGIET